MRQWPLDCAKQSNVGNTTETVTAARCRGVGRAGGRGGDNVNASPAHARRGLGGRELATAETRAGG